MKKYFVRVYNTTARLKQDFDAFVKMLQDMPSFDKNYYNISYSRAKVETPESVTQFIVQNREFFIGKDIDWVYFDEFTTFNSEIVNEAVGRMLRTQTKRFLNNS
jgi:hypothetical protein